tara:strand:- start:99 stop:323 length:225 start_codon:yes stop_codon:yes gene_type:complete
MKRYYIVIPKNEFTNEMETELSLHWDSSDSSQVMGLLVVSNVPNIFSNYKLLNKIEYHEELENNPELWIPEELR